MIAGRNIGTIMKKSRHEKIIELINEREISTQEELTSLLNELGYKTTQATVSRDIRALHLKKVPARSGQKYAVSNTNPSSEDKYLRIFSEGLTGMDQASNIVVIKTISGMAMAVAAALDGLDLHEIVGSIAGDDTIMCACRSEEDAYQLISKLNTLLKGLG